MSVTGYAGVLADLRVRFDLLRVLRLLEASLKLRLVDAGLHGPGFIIFGRELTLIFESGSVELPKRLRATQAEHCFRGERGGLCLPRERAR